MTFQRPTTPITYSVSAKNDSSSGELSGRNSTLPNTASHSPVQENKKKDEKEKPLVIRWTGLGKTKSLLHFLGNYWERNTFCQEIQKKHKKKKEKQLEIRMGCEKMFRRGQLGTGNFLTGLYGLRLAAASLNVTLHLHCDDAVATQTRLVLPWLMGTFLPTSTASQQQPASSSVVCSTFNKAPIGRYMVPAMQYEFRRMALALVGVPEGRPDVQEWWASTQQQQQQHNLSNATSHYQLYVGSVPLTSGVQLDDAVIHFRCGDLMDSMHNSYGFLQFSSYAKHIPKHVQSIGIVTQPFTTPDNKNDTTTEADNRPADRIEVTGPRCRLVVSAFARYLHQAFPAAARITVRNQESMAVAYARIVLARDVVVSAMSSFAVFPMMATFATNGAHLRYPGPPCVGPYQWVKQVPHRLDDGNSSSNVSSSLHLFHDNRVLKASEVRALWASKRGVKKLFKWFWGEQGRAKGAQSQSASARN